MNILAIESSCDDTGVAIVKDGREVLSNVVASQVPEHILYGGVVPEIASRRHCESISAVCQKALDDAGLTLKDLDAIAVTYAPGLIGALLVGVNFAKAYAMARGLPLVPVHHMRGHIAANYIAFPALEPPFCCLVVSGGHSLIVDVAGYTDMRILGTTRDDAAGEAFDKCARALGLGYPGGPIIDKMSKEGNPKAVRFPRARVKDTLDFSFSGLKTAVVRYAESSEDDIKDITASFQAAVVDVLVSHTFKAARERGVKQVLVAGGVAANSGLKNAMTEKGKRTGIAVSVPPMVLCTDNAAMIAAAAYYNYDKYLTHDLRLDCKASEPIGV